MIKPPPGGYCHLGCVLSHDMGSCVTRGILSTNIADASDFFLRRIEASKAEESHPLFLATIYVEWRKEMVSRHCIYIRSMPRQVESHTGHGDLDEVHLPGASGPQAGRPDDYTRLRIGLSRC